LLLKGPTVFVGKSVGIFVATLYFFLVLPKKGDFAAKGLFYKGDTTTCGARLTGEVCV